MEESQAKEVLRRVLERMPLCRVLSLMAEILESRVAEVSFSLNGRLWGNLDDEAILVRAAADIQATKQRR